MASAIISISVFPLLQKRYKTSRLYMFFLWFYVLAFVVMPIGHIAAEVRVNGINPEALTWTAIVAILIPVRISVMVYPYVSP